MVKKPARSKEARKPVKPVRVIKRKPARPKDARKPVTPVRTADGDTDAAESKPPVKKLSTMLKKAEANAVAAKVQPSQVMFHVIVNALAGTGKTFTLVVGIANLFRDLVWSIVVGKLGFDPEPSPEQRAVWDLMDCGGRKPKSIVYIAFNKSIVEEFQAKWKFLTDALAGNGVSLGFSTIHSMGFQACCKAYGLSFRNINKFRVRNLLEAQLGHDLREYTRTESGRLFVDAVEALVRMAKLTLAHDPEVLEREGRVLVNDDALDNLCSHYGISVGLQRDKVFAMVNTLLNACRRPKDDGEINFDDQIWLPVINNLDLWRNDLLLVDEGQDLNRCQQALAMKAGWRIVLCGDVHQAIYGFAGADVDSIPRMTDTLGRTKAGVKTAPLTVTRRCGKRIVEEARFLVPQFEAHDSNPEGVVRSMSEGKDYEDLLAEVTDADFILCRVNAPLVRIAFMMLKLGRKANIQGRDLGTGMKAMIKSSGKGTVDAFLDWLDDYFDKEAKRINRRKNKDEEALIALQDRVECLRMFAEGASSLKEVGKNIDLVFKGKRCPSCGKDQDGTHCYQCKETDPGTRLKVPVRLVKPEGVLLSSVHRAKGLEAPRVFILKPGVMPHPMAKTEWARGQESNLRYVAITRAIKELVWVEEDNND